ncbi:MAG: hypothetical protein FK734_03380 [Asgard group archaeon]|nr:hypothetical protein [Asgard group archaeon]
MQTLLAVSVKCPSCGASLMDTENKNDISCIILNIKNDNQVGSLKLCPIYSNHEYSTDFEITSNREYTFTCPNCNSVLNTKRKCNHCEASMVQLQLKEGGSVKFCSRAGCAQPSIEFEKLDEALDYFYEMFKFG